jgi:hypothetical protein
LVYVPAFPSRVALFPHVEPGAYPMKQSTHSTPRSDPSTPLRTSARGMLRVDTERRFLPRFKNRGVGAVERIKYYFEFMFVII